MKCRSLHLALSSTHLSGASVSEIVTGILRINLTDTDQ
jgi:hypothetical protein